MKNTIKGLFAAAGLMLAMSSHAITIDYIITLEQAGGETYEGTFGVDDSLLAPSTTIPLVDFDYFEITIGGFSWDLGMVFSASDDIAYTNAMADVDELAGGGTGGVTADFCQFGASNCLGFGALGTNNWRAYLGANGACNNGLACEGTYTITRVSAPAPATLALLGLGLAGIGFARRK